LSEIRELFDIYATAGNERPQLAKFLQLLAERRAMLHQQREDIDVQIVGTIFNDRDGSGRQGSSSGAAPAGGGDGE
jgi:hypothetical protein